MNNYLCPVNDCLCRCEPDSDDFCKYSSDHAEMQKKEKASQVEPVVMCEYSQGICEDGAAILCDGEMLTIEQIISRLRESENTKKLYEFELNERMNIFTKTIESMTNGEWDKLKEINPKLHAFVKQAVNR